MLEIKYPIASYINAVIKESRGCQQYPAAILIAAYSDHRFVYQVIIIELVLSSFDFI